MTRVLVTGACGYIAAQILDELRDRYELVLLDASQTNRKGEAVAGVTQCDLIDPDSSRYRAHFESVDAVVHLAYKRRTGAPLDHFYDEKLNVEMAYNVLRCAYEAGVPRVVMASSNHAADWYEHHLIHSRKIDSLDPYALPLSDNFYGWAKATYEHLGFLFACGLGDFAGAGGQQHHTTGATPQGSHQMGVVMVRIGAPRPLDRAVYADAAAYKRDLGAYISPRDMTQLFVRSIETVDIANEHGVPWQVVYGISDNTRAFWSLANARAVLGYAPEDDSEAVYAEDIRAMLGSDAQPGRVG